MLKFVLINERESSFQIYLLVKTYKRYKKKFTRWFNQKKAWRSVLHIDACAATKHEIILLWPTFCKM